MEKGKFISSVSFSTHFGTGLLLVVQCVVRLLFKAANHVDTHIVKKNDFDKKKKNLLIPKFLKINADTQILKKADVDT